MEKYDNPANIQDTNQMTAWAEINLNAIAHNVRELRRITQPNAKLMAVVKADGYGHGAIQVAEQALQNGAELLGTARFHEAVELRQAGFDVPILILGYTLPNLAEELIRFNLTQTVYSYKNACILPDSALSESKKIKVHLKTDTGMRRLGFSLLNKEEFYNEVSKIFEFRGLEVEGIFTHFATSDSSDKTFAHKQFLLFTQIIEELKSRKIEFALKHCANSGAIIDMPETHLNMVRAGISLYGLYPSNEIDKSRINLKPAMALKSRIIHLKDVSSGFSVSYGCTYKTEKPTKIATVAIGYADGLNRLLSSKGYMLVHGCKAPVLGRICMDLTMLDVGHISDVKIGDEVVIFGKQKNSEISVDEIANALNTINYEIVSTITERVKRVYL